MGKIVGTVADIEAAGSPLFGKVEGIVRLQGTGAGQGGFPPRVDEDDLIAQFLRQEGGQQWEMGAAQDEGVNTRLAQGLLALGRALAGGLRASARAVRRSMECLSPDLAVSPFRPSSAARFASLRLASPAPRRRAARASSTVVSGSPGSGKALLAGMRPCKMG